MDLNSPHDQYSWFLFKGDLIKEARITFIAIRVLYIGLLFIVFVGIMTSIILSTVNPNPEYDSWGLGGFFLTGFMGTVLIVTMLVTFKIAYKIAYTFSSIPPGKSKTALFIDRALLGGFFLFPTLIGFLISKEGEVWWVVLPLFINSGLALWWKFPTKKRWEKWAEKLEPRPPRDDYYNDIVI